jgi:hypothetical protein
MSRSRALDPISEDPSGESSQHGNYVPYTPTSEIQVETPSTSPEVPPEDPNPELISATEDSSHNTGS